MATFSYESSGDTSRGGRYLEAPGTYHVVITAVEDRPTNRKGELIDNAAFRIDVAVCAGTVENQAGKVTDILFFHPKPSDKEDGKFAKKKFDMLFLATSLLTEDQVKEGNRPSINLDDLVGRQMVAKFKERDEKYIELSFSDMWHVDDPAVKDIPKDKDSLALLPPEQRLTGSKAKAPSPLQQKPQPAYSDNTADMNLSDI